MIVCNMYDAYLHIRVALDTKCLDEIIAIGVLTKSPLADSVALDAGCVMDWSAEPLRQGKYRGAIVLDPSVGFHRNVFTLDFKSLYPSIMIGLNISPETVTTFDVYDDDVREQYVELMGLRADGSMTWTSDATLLRMNDVIVSIDRRAEGIQPKFLKYLMTKRSAIKKSNGGKDTPLSFAMKIAANSTYGACGSSTSGMSTRYGAASVTATGRTLLSLAVAIATLLGFEALYGDTDSIFLRMPEGSRFTVYNYQVIQSLWLCHWGFSVSWTRGILHFLL
ncbi:hypothetical protein DFJ73DRAFT_851952 [Zopfochytrium polystomum]|nr:hypothetical protein DFJ73DRAFT_851952 [Zopfochytrium polystomum]